MIVILESVICERERERERERKVLTSCTRHEDEMNSDEKIKTKTIGRDDCCVHDCDDAIRPLIWRQQPK
jgi:hypothetical protein